MEISNILLENLKGQALKQIANSVGGDEKGVKSLASKALPMILGQLEKNASEPSGAEAINEALNAHLGESKIDIEDGKNILSHIFSQKQEAISAVAKAAGKSEQESEGVMAALSSVIMETLGDQKKASGGFGAQDIMKMLSGTGKDSNILEMVMDQDGDGDFDSQDATKFGMNWIKKKFFGK